jgi:hypothetical protein
MPLLILAYIYGFVKRNLTPRGEGPGLGQPRAKPPAG